MAQEEKKKYSVRRHCGNVKGSFYCNQHNVVAWNCNCSDFLMQANVHIIISQQHFSLDLEDGKTLQDLITILYEWGTKVARRHFCKTCMILPWYRPRSNPDGIAITLNCIDWGEGEKPRVETKFFDGIHWEESFAA
jgi:hypothetical protein